MHNPYSPPKAIVEDIEVERSRVGVMFSSAIASILSVTTIIVVGMLTTRIPLDYKIFAGIAVMVIPMSIVIAAAVASFRRLNTYVAAIACSVVTLILTLAISYGFGSRL